RPAPGGVDAQPGRIVGIAPLCVGTSVRPGSAVEPVAAGGGTVIAQPGKAGQLLSGLPFVRRRQLFVLEIRQGLTVDLLGYRSERRAAGIGVSPTQVQDGIGELAAILLVQFAYLEEDL